MPMRATAAQGPHPRRQRRGIIEAILTLRPISLLGHSHPRRQRRGIIEALARARPVRLARSSIRVDNDAASLKPSGILQH